MPKTSRLIIDVEAMTSRLLIDIGTLKIADHDVVPRLVSRKVDEYCERVRRRLDEYDKADRAGSKSP